MQHPAMRSNEAAGGDPSQIRFAAAMPLPLSPRALTIALLFLTARPCTASAVGSLSHKLPDPVGPRLAPKMLEIGVAGSLQRAERLKNTSLIQAAEMLRAHPAAPQELVALATRLLGPVGSGHRRHHRGHRDVQDDGNTALLFSRSSSSRHSLTSGHLRAASHVRHGKKATGEASTAGPLRMLNTLVVETEWKKDLACMECSEYEEQQRQTMEDIRQDISSATVEATGARSELVRLDSDIEEVEHQLPVIKEELTILSRKCNQESDILKGQLAILVKDIEIMAKVLSSTHCRSSGLFLLGCHSRRQHLVQLRSKSARQRLQKAGVSAFSCTMPCDIPGPPVGRKRRSKCAVKNNPSCPHLRDHFLGIQTDILEKRSDLEQELAETEDDCSKNRLHYNARINNLRRELADAQVSLASATKRQNDAEARAHTQTAEHELQAKEYKRAMRSCHTKAKDFESQICGFQKIRSELERMAGLDGYILDCEVSQWTREECTVTCGGGTQQLYRSVVVQPSRGAACPPLELVRRCGEQRCPVHCRLDSWGGWSACSAECGGGVQERVRNVLERPRYHGRACGETTETQSCNMQACDADCSLSPWTGWSDCSRSCGGGLQTRKRQVESPAMGRGKCPSARSRARVNYRPCNKHACVELKRDEPLRCDKKLDVVLLLDGSGSLGDEGWLNTKKAARMIAESLVGGKDKVQLAVQLFSGPKTWGGYRRCVMSGARDVHLKIECGIEWVTHFTTDMEDVIWKMSRLRLPGASTLTSAALSLAEAELQLGRRGVKKVVIVITDGKPMSPRRTARVARKLRRKARLMWVPVSKHAPWRFMKKWSTRPVRDNLVLVKDFPALGNASTVNTIVQRACS